MTRTPRSINQQSTNTTMLSLHQQSITGENATETRLTRIYDDCRGKLAGLGEAS